MLFNELPPTIFYFHDPYQYLWHLDQQQNVAISWDRLRSLKSYKLVIVDLSREHWGHNPDQDLIDRVYDILEQAELEFVLLSHRPEDHDRRPCLRYFPSDYHNCVEKFIYAKNKTDDEVRTYPVSCLNGAPRSHRIYNFFGMRRRTYFSSLLWSMHKHKINSMIRQDEPVLDDDTRSQWQMIEDEFPEYGSIQGGSEFVGEYIHGLDHPAYTDSYINIVSEHMVLPGIYITEKTWKPIASGQFFLIIGAPGTVSHLRDLGVDVFDDIIDHDSYDHLPDWRQRIDRIHEVVDHLVKQDLKSLFLSTQTRRERNVSLFRSGSFDQQYLSGLQELVNKYGQ